MYLLLDLVFDDVRALIGGCSSVPSCSRNDSILQTRLLAKIFCALATGYILERFAKAATESNRRRPQVGSLSGSTIGKLDAAKALVVYVLWMTFGAR
jgi:hypothetical protein